MSLGGIMRKFVLIIYSLSFLIGMNLMTGTAAYAFDFLKSVENAAKSVEKTLDETFDKKKPGSDESHEENIDQAKELSEVPEVAKQTPTEKDGSVVDGVKDQASDMYKTVKGVFVSDDEKAPDATKVKEAAQKTATKADQSSGKLKDVAQTPADAAIKTSQSAEKAKEAVQAPERAASQATQAPAALKGVSAGSIKSPIPNSSNTGLSLPGVSGSNENVNLGATAPASAGGSAIKAKHRVISEGSWTSCKNKQELSYNNPPWHDNPGKGKEIHCMARIDVTARALGTAGRSARLRLLDPISRSRVQGIEVRGFGSTQSKRVKSGTFFVEIKNTRTHETKELGLIEIKPDSKHSIRADFASAVLDLNLKSAEGKKARGQIQVQDAASGKIAYETAKMPPYRIFIYPGKFIIKIKSKSLTNKQFNIELELKQGQQAALDITLSKGEKPPKVGSSEIKKWREIDWLVPAGGKATKVVPEKSVKEQVGKVILFADVNRTKPPRLKVRLKDSASGKVVEEFEQYAERRPKGKYVKAGKYRLEVEGIDSGRKLNLGVVQIKPGKVFKRDLKLKYTDVIVSVKDAKGRTNQVWLDFKDPASGKVIRKASGFPKIKTYLYPAKYSMEIRRTPKDATPMAVVSVNASKGGKVNAKVDISNIRVAAGGKQTKPVKVKAEANPCGNIQKGRSGCLRLTVRDTDGKPLKYVLDYKSLSGGSGGSHREPMELFRLTPGKTQFLLKCQGKRKAFVVEAKADQLVEREFVFPAVYKGKVAVNCKMGDGGFGNFGISLYDPETGKRKYSTTDGADGKGTPFEVNTGKYRLVVDYRETKMKKDLGLIEVKKGQTLTKTAVLERGTASLTFYDSKGEMVGPDIRIVDSNTGKLIHAISGPPEPYVFQLAPGKYKVEAKKDYKSRKNIENISIKNNEVLTKDITLLN
jgi:hypothetical protein